MQPIREWRIHVGAHKTATTHFQDALAARREALRALGVDFLPRDAVRGARPLPSAASRRFRLEWPPRRDPGRTLARLRSGPDRIALSEENILGVSGDLLSWPFYPRLARRLRPFDSLADGAELTLFLSVRGFEGLLPSAYAQALRTRPVPGGFGPIAAAALDSPPSWLELVRRIAAAAPRARLRVWRFEDYLTREQEILSRFCGVAAPPADRLPPPDFTRTPSARAVARIEALSPLLPRALHKIAARRIIASDGSDEKFSPFSPSQRSLLREACEEDLARLQRELPGVLMTVDD
ncbi:MAG: hypothetical protein ACQEUZ_02255 [Pseudomonadota bacterium]